MLPLVKVTSPTVSLKLPSAKVPPFTVTAEVLAIWLFWSHCTVPPATSRLPAIASMPAVLARCSVPLLSVVVPEKVFADAPENVKSPVSAKV